MCRYYIQIYHVKTGHTEKIAKKLETWWIFLILCLLPKI